VLKYNTRRVIQVENVASKHLENDGFSSGFNGVENPIS
jgi:hypothetical protein